MAWFVLLLIQVGLQILTGLLTSKGAKPEKELDLPHADASTPIPVPWGECLIKDPMLLDYMDFQTKAIKIRNPATFFITTLTIGYEYYLGMVFGVCWGTTPQVLEGTKLLAVVIDNRKAWHAVAEDGYEGAPKEGGLGSFNAEDDPIIINRPSFFGSEKQEGGVRVEGYWYTGVDFPANAQEPNAYWEAQRAVTMPDYKDIAYFVWHGPAFGNLPGLYSGKKSGYIGNAPRLWPLAFKVKRQPCYLTNGSVGRPGDTPSSNGDHANPIEAMYECLVSTNFGAGISEAHIYGGTGAGIPDQFAFAAYTCWEEGLAFSYVWSSASPVEEMIAEILRYVDGALWTDPADGLIKIKLARADYDIGDLDTLTNDDFVEIENFTRGSWRETKNEVRISFPDHSKVDFEQNTATWRSPANFQIQGANEPAEITFRGCPSLLLANRLAAREGRVVSQPLARLRAKVDRKAWQFHPCSLFVFDWPEQGIENLAMRVTTMDLGTLAEGTITINAVQDVFADGEATYAPTVSTVWTDPLEGDAEDAPFASAGEVPYWLQRDDVPRVFGVASKPDTTHVAYDGSLDGDADALNSDFTPTGTLVAELDQLAETDYNTAGFTVEDVDFDPDLIEAGTATEIAAEGASLAIIGDPDGDHEWIAFQSVTDNEDATVTLDNIWRGLLDTPPREWPVGSRVWFFSVGSSLFSRPLDDAQAITFEALTRTMRDQLLAADATNHTYTTQSRALAPLPPYYVLLGGSYTNLQQDTGDLVFTWREHSRLAMLQILKQSATTETAESGVEYEIDIYDASTGTPALLRNVTGLASPTYTYTNADELSDLGSATLAVRLRLDFYSTRDGMRSLYPWQRYVYRTDPATFDDAVTHNGDLVVHNGDLVVST